MGDHADKLSRVRALPHDEDERPSREDREPLPGEGGVFASAAGIAKWFVPRRLRGRS